MGIGRPALVIRLEVEERPHVLLDALDEGERVRVLDWVEAQPELAEIVARAIEAEERAA